MAEVQRTRVRQREPDPGDLYAQHMAYFQELRDRALTGKIVVINQPTARAQDGSGYGALSAARRQGPVEAAKRGAAAFLIRSLSTGDETLPHTGSAVIATQAWPTIPCHRCSRSG